MRISVGYPVLSDPRGFIQVGQNRQSKLFSVGEEAAIFPCVMAWAATLLKQDGHEVLWFDGQIEQSWKKLKEFHPKVILWEAKTPSIKPTWEAVRTIKDWWPTCTVVLCGDHVTALPEESLLCSLVDIILTGGDYHFGIQAIIEKCFLGDIPRDTNDPRMHYADYLNIPDRSTRGIWYQDTQTPLTMLPVIDRELCRWKDYSRMGNYLYRPGTHGYSAADCWWRHDGGCTFCSWTNTYKNYRQLTVDQFMADVESAHALGAREYFDDAGTWAPPGSWFEESIRCLTQFNKAQCHFRARMAIGCNDRPGARQKSHYKDMARAGFRFILYGLESANFETLQRINKGQHAEDMRNAAKWATESGLQPHLTVMFGYPWETADDATETITLVSELFNKGWANSMQATLLMPYPGTTLFRDAKAAGWLLTEDWNRYTMNECILKCPMSHQEVLEKIRECYQSAVTPKYILNKIITVRTRDDLRFFWRGFKFWWGHRTDFQPRRVMGYI